MTLTEVRGNLFTAPQGCYLVHCISGDFSLGAGIAKQFDEVYNMRFKLFRDYPLGEGQKYGYVGAALKVDNVFNLVTKPRSYHQPKYDTLRETLVDLLEWCQHLDITKLAMPRLGCGLDKLDWDIVKETIEEVFADSDVNILVYTL